MRLDLSAPLPIVPPPEEDELISSWLDRVARFYSTPTWELFGLIRGKTTVSLYAVDLGTSERALGLIAKRLGITSTQLFVHTIAGVYPWAVDLVARDPYTSSIPPGAAAFQCLGAEGRLALCSVMVGSVHERDNGHKFADQAAA